MHKIVLFAQNALKKQMYTSLYVNFLQITKLHKSHKLQWPGSALTTSGCHYAVCTRSYIIESYREVSCL